jgi:hypothetical protein
MCDQKTILGSLGRPQLEGYLCHHGQRRCIIWVMALSKSPGDGAASDKDIAELQRELQHIQAKDGAFTEWEEKRVDALHQILGAEPRLRDLLVNLDVRQRKEISALGDRQNQTTVRDKKYDAICRQQYRDLDERHHQERQRYIRQYTKGRERAERAEDNRPSFDLEK